MQATLRTEFTALPGSQRPQSIRLLAQQPVRLLQLHESQRIVLRVSAGRLWLTEEGRLDDHVLGGGAQLALRGPARYHLGAFGPEGVLLTASES